MTPRAAQIIRQFPQNGMKLLLEDPRNVRELLRLTGAAVVDRIDFGGMRRVQTTFVQPDYRHVESDVVLTAPLLAASGRRPKRQLLVYVLIEHQSEPDRLMPLRVLEYVVQVFKHQTRAWSRTHRSLARLQLQPVLPVVFYTGLRKWNVPERLVDLIASGEAFADVTPAMRPLLVNLPETSPALLESKGGDFGWVLRLIQERRARTDEFEALLEQVVRHLERMPASERLRWLELLSYVQALVYHERAEVEHPGLRSRIEKSVETDEHRVEVRGMVRTMAEAMTEKGRIEGELLARQTILVRQLRTKFGRVPAAVTRRIKETADVKRLDVWLDRVPIAASLDDVGLDDAGIAASS